MNYYNPKRLVNGGLPLSNRQLEILLTNLHDDVIGDEIISLKRIRAPLMRLGFRFWFEIIPYSIGDLKDLKGIGIGAVGILIDYLARYDLESDKDFTEEQAWQMVNYESSKKNTRLIKQLLNLPAHLEAFADEQVKFLLSPFAELELGKITGRFLELMFEKSYQHIVEVVNLSEIEFDKLMREISLRNDDSLGTFKYQVLFRYKLVFGPLSEIEKESLEQYVMQGKMIPTPIWKERIKELLAKL